MKSEGKQPSNFAFEKMPSRWIVTKRSRPTIEGFDSYSKCTALTLDLSSFDDYSSSPSTSSSSLSSFSSISPSESTKWNKGWRETTLKNASCPREEATNTIHETQTIQPSVTANGDDTRQPPKQPVKIESISPSTIPKALRDHCGKSTYWMEPTTKRRRTRDGSRHWCSANDSVTPMARNSRIVGSHTSGGRPPTSKSVEFIKFEKKTIRTLDPEVLRVSDSWSTRFSKNDNNNDIIFNTAKGKVKIIGIPGVRSRWAWIENDIATKTKSSPTCCRKRNRNRNKKTETKTTTTTDTEDVITTKLTTPTTVSHAGERDSIHTKNEIGDCLIYTSNSLKALRDHCGQGTYWTEPTQRRRLSSPKFYAFTASVGETSQSKDDHADNRSGDSCDNTKTNIPTRKKKRCSATRNLEREDVPSSLTHAWIASNSNITGTTSNADHTRNTDNVTKVSRNEKTRRPHDSAEITTETLDSGNETSIAIVKPTPTTSISATDNLSSHQKITLRAMEGPNQPIPRYALDLISLVCNNSSSADCALQHDGSKTFYRPYQQAHRVLDKPPVGYTTETESEKERLIRLQFRQRFASATSIGMSPIEFANKLLGLWGGRLEEVVSTEETNSHVVDNVADDYKSRPTRRVNGDGKQGDGIEL